MLEGSGNKVLRDFWKEDELMSRLQKRYDELVPFICQPDNLPKIVNEAAGRATDSLQTGRTWLDFSTLAA
jgi:hypothetical protein